MCYKFIFVVMEKDFFYVSCLFVYIGMFVELNKVNEFFYFFYKLVDLYFSNFVFWFVVGCYYFMVGYKNEYVRRYFSKVIIFEKIYGFVWIVYGYLFVVESEYD